MEICRLCGQEKKPFVISLRDEIKDGAKFIDFIEYFFPVTIDKSPNLPQRVCEECRDKIERYSEFSYEMDEQQKKFAKMDHEETEEKIPEDCKDSKKPKKEENEELEYEPQLSLTEENLLEEIDGKKNLAMKEAPEAPTLIPAEGSKRMLLRERRQSIFEKKSLISKTIAENFEEAEKTIKAAKLTRPQFSYQTIHIDKSLINQETGEVPTKWLRGYKEFTTWHDITYQCNDHCKEKFSDFYSFLDHNQKNIAGEKRSVSCHLCSKNFSNTHYLCSYINHMVKMHYEHIKFCCIVCSQVFYDVPFLSQHYQEHHPEICLGRMFLCFYCGLVCQGIRGLEIHLQQHLKK